VLLRLAARDLDRQEIVAVADGLDDDEQRVQRERRGRGERELCRRELGARRSW
jgi:hypothetical protein